MPFLSKKQVMERTGLSATTIWRRIQARDFPQPRQLSPNRVGWPEHEIQAWEDSRPVIQCDISDNLEQEII